MSLAEYKHKRNFRKTTEPAGSKTKPHHGQLSMFVIQKHDASHLHFDFRLEVDGVLKSWAVPKGPSVDPKDKRLAMMVEDHPLSYRDFEGTIPEGSYGAGQVIVWDTGTFTTDHTQTKAEREKYMLAGIAKGDLKFELHGQKLNGHFALVKMHTKDGKSWLLIKEHDQFESTGTEFSQLSVLSEQTLTVDGEQPAKKNSHKKSTLPAFFTPMLATLIDKPFTKPGWIFEPKLDGFRTLAFIEHGQVQLYSRNQVSLNKKFPSIVEALKNFPLSAVIDGEVAGLNQDGQIAFQALQNADRHPEQLYYYVFDLPFLAGQDLKNLPLTDRKNLLKKAVKDLSHVRFVEATTNGHQLFALAAKNGAEGILAKKADSLYQPEVRSENWLKIKITQQQEAVICGYTKPQGSRKHFGSLLLGVYEDGILHYVGHTGTGFPETELTKLKSELDKRRTKLTSFNSLPAGMEKNVTWVKPELICEVKFAGWTDDHQLRQAVYLRLRTDKNATDIQLETPEKLTDALHHKHQHQPLHLSHPEKVYWPKLGLTKKDLLQYYAEVAPIILPYLKDRPESLNRMPSGIDEPGFFQKDITFDVPSFVQLETVTTDDVGDTRYLICNNPETLLYMANLGCIEINPWNSRLGSLDCPDYLVIDLDPLEVKFSKVVEVALTVKKILDTAKVSAYCKTSGKKGLHIFVPLHGKYEMEISGNFAKLVASLTHQLLPELTSLERSPSQRQGKVYVDFLQNRQGQTIAAPYSLRPTAEATASTPLKWSELTTKLDPKSFTIESLPKRIHQIGDVWAGMLDQKNNLQQAVKNLQTYLEK